MDKIDIEQQDNFQSSLNPHDAHVQAWTGQLDPLHPMALIDRIRQAELDSFGNAWDYWQEVDKPTQTNQTEPAPAPAPAPTAETPEHAPVVDASNGKKWTHEKLAELNAYREAHTMPETAKKFGISESRIRALLPSNKPKGMPFSGLIHRIK